VAPVKRCLERLLTRRGGAATRAEKAEPVVEAGGEHSRGERVHAGGRKLERQRKSVEAVTDPGNARRGLVIEGKAGCDGAGPLHEQTHSLVAKERLRLLLAVRIGNAEGRDAEDDLPGDSQRLAARRKHGELGRPV
jgi:hypothetical protein